MGAAGIFADRICYTAADTEQETGADTDRSIEHWSWNTGFDWNISDIWKGFLEQRAGTNDHFAGPG